MCPDNIIYYSNTFNFYTCSAFLLLRNVKFLMNLFSVYGILFNINLSAKYTLLRQNLNYNGYLQELVFYWF